jgi:hypothetical protein
MCQIAVMEQLMKNLNEWRDTSMAGAVWLPIFVSSYFSKQF